MEIAYEDAWIYRRVIVIPNRSSSPGKNRAIRDGEVSLGAAASVSHGGRVRRVRPHVADVPLGKEMGGMR